MESPKIIVIPGFTLIFRLSKRQNLGYLGVLRVGKLPIKKLCMIKNF